MTPIFVLALAMLLRAVISVQSHKNKHAEKFDFKYYFDFKHSFRWVIHIITSTLCFLLLPELFSLIKIYYKDLSSFRLIGAAVIGFGGYDLIRLLEKASFWMAKKVNIPLEEWVTKTKEDEGV